MLLSRQYRAQCTELITVLATLALAALFNPLRRGVQSQIDRRFYRRKFDTLHVLAAFSAPVRDGVELDRLGEHPVEAVDETMQPAQVSLWLKGPEREAKR